jgi:hypothetical protein
MVDAFATERMRPDSRGIARVPLPHHLEKRLKVVSEFCRIEQAG